jgi:competence protein ComEC
VGAFVSSIFLFRENKKLRVISLLVVFLLFGLARVESEKLSEVKILEVNALNNQNISAEGEIFLMPEVKNGRQKIVLKNIKDINSGSVIDGKVVVYTSEYPEYNFSDKIKIKGTIKIPENFDSFEYRNYLFSKGVYYISYYPEIELVARNKSGIYFQIIEFRKYAGDLVKKIFPQPQAGIVSAMTLGMKSGISDKVLDAFNKTGTRHIIAISGLHLTVIALILMYSLLAVGLNRNHAFYFAVLGIAFFVTLVGFPSSAVRAAVMSGLVLLAVKIGRLSNAGNAIIFAGVLMLLYNPNWLRYDVGFQLSFAATLGIVYIFPKLNSLFEKYSNFLNIKTIFLITISAQLATLPIVINNFGNFSLLSVFANVLILPFVPMVMLGGFLVVAVGSVNLFLAQVLSWPVWAVLSYQIAAIEFFSRIDLGYLSFEKISAWFIVFYYAILVLWLNYAGIRKTLTVTVW